MEPGIGIDLIEISWIEKSVSDYGDRFLNRIFTTAEIGYCSSRANPYSHYAARFAAKEAFAKAAGTGIGQEIGWQDIEIVREFSGRPGILISERIRQRFTGFQVLLSVSHTHDYAVAMVSIQPDRV